MLGALPRLVRRPSVSGVGTSGVWRGAAGQYPSIRRINRDRRIRRGSRVVAATGKTSIKAPTVLARGCACRYNSVLGIRLDGLLQLPGHRQALADALFGQPEDVRSQSSVLSLAGRPPAHLPA